MPAVGWPNIFSARPALGLEFSHAAYSSCRHAQQLPHAIGKGTTTRSPTLRFETPRPVSTTSPMNSWPRMSPFFIVGMYPSYRCKSEPQIAVELIFTIASRSLRIFGSGTFSTWTVLRPDHTFALTAHPPYQARNPPTAAPDAA